MRSLIILEVEHGEDTDALMDLLDKIGINENGFVSVPGAVVNDYTVKIDLPECFTL